MGAATLFLHNVSIFHGFRKIIYYEVLKLHWILNFIWVIDISGWRRSLQFLSVTLPVMKIKPRLFYSVVKNLGRPRPFRRVPARQSPLLSAHSAPLIPGTRHLQRRPESLILNKSGVLFTISKVVPFWNTGLYLMKLLIRT